MRSWWPERGTRQRRPSPIAWRPATTAPWSAGLWPRWDGGAMPPLSVGEVVEATGGSLLRGSPRTLLTSFSIDTRTLTEHGLFFALPGSRTDGHAFLHEAARAGAAAAVIARPPAT